MKVTGKIKGFFKQIFSGVSKRRAAKKQRKKMILDERIQEVKENERRLATLKRNMVSKRKKDAMPSERPQYNGAKSFGTDYDIEYRPRREVEYDDPMMNYGREQRQSTYDDGDPMMNYGREQRRDSSSQRHADSRGHAAQESISQRQARASQRRQHVNDDHFNDFYDEEEAKRQNTNPSVVRVSNEVPVFTDIGTGYKKPAPRIKMRPNSNQTSGRVSQAKSASQTSGRTPQAKPASQVKPASQAKPAASQAKPAASQAKSNTPPGVTRSSVASQQQKSASQQQSAASQQNNLPDEEVKGNMDRFKVNQMNLFD